MTNRPRSVFLTGFTGTLGRELVKGFLNRTQDRLTLLVRRKHRYSHWDRARKILSACGCERFLGTRVEVLEGDVTLPDFGLRSDALERLRRETREFYHIAAITALNVSEEEADRVNRGGTFEAVRLARDFRERGVLERFFYFSTAYAVGSRQTYCAKEDELPVYPAHANFYESSKYAAEAKVREAIRDGLPAAIFRPSIVVGNSSTGEVSDFNVIYPFMRLFAHGILTKLPTRLENSFNIVPIDFVINAALAISRRPDSAGKTFHLVTQEPPTIGMLLELKEELYPELPAIEVIRPEEFSRENLDANESLAFEMLAPYLGYLNDNLTFDASNTETALAGTGISFPKTDYEFLKVLTRYAVDAGYLVVR